MADDDLQTVQSVHKHDIRVPAERWAHIVEAHDYMAGNLDKVIETIAEPERIIQGESGEALALRLYEATNITRKTCVAIYRDEADGFLITAFFTSHPGTIERKGPVIWQKP